MNPFLTLYTPTYRRPRALLRNLASVQAQSAVDDIEQIVIPDHVGIGIDGMYARVHQYAPAVHGRYVAFLCDDDVLATDFVVSQVRQAVSTSCDGNPALVLVRTLKGGSIWPTGDWWPPQLGQIDLNCAIVRSDVWKAHAASFAACYEGDYWFLRALADAGVEAMRCDVLFSSGAVSRGAAEAA